MSKEYYAITSLKVIEHNLSSPVYIVLTVDKNIYSIHRTTIHPTNAVYQDRYNFAELLNYLKENGLQEQ